MVLSTIKTLLARGAFVGTCDINKAGLEREISTLNRDEQSRTLAQKVDVTNRSAVKAFLEDTKQHFGGRLDGVANIAGTGGYKLGLEQV
jgi:NAD(P)-dependent dehydrogenase (short-subunit alcohol dehydrogenase family)